MKICMIIMTEFVNDARVTKEINTLVKSGYNPDIFALKSKETEKYEKKDGYRIFRISVKLRYLLPRKHVFFFLKYLEFAVRVIFKAGKEKYSLFHAHDLETLPIGFILSVIYKKPLVYDSHELYVDMVKHGRFTKRLWFAVEKFLAGRTNANILTTESRGKIFSERYSTEFPYIIKNVQILKPLIKTNKLHDILNIPKTEPIILYQGIVSKARGVDVLVDAIEYVKKGVLVLIGPGEYKTNLIEDVDERGLGKRVFILDPVPWKDLYLYTASASIGISLVQNIGLNNYTMLSNKLFEYLSAGLPVIFPDFPEWRNLIISEGVGLVVDQTNPGEVADAINEILLSDDKYSAMSAKARKIVENKYNWGIEEKKLLKIYRDLLN